MRKEMTPTMENYLEVVGELTNEMRVVRVTDIAHELHVKMPSVTEALKVLTKDGLIRHEKYGCVELTQSGKRIASEIYSRHQILFKFLREILQIDPKTANEDACRMEHSISSESMESLIEFINNLESYPPESMRSRKLQ